MEFLIILTIKSTLIILLAAVLLVALKRNSATLRHWVISLTMIGLLGLPLFIEVLPSVTVEVPYLGKQAIPKNEPLPPQAIKKSKIVEPTIPTHTKVLTPAEVINPIQ